MSNGSIATGSHGNDAIVARARTTMRTATRRSCESRRYKGRGGSRGGNRSWSSRRICSTEWGEGGGVPDAPQGCHAYWPRYDARFRDSETQPTDACAVCTTPSREVGRRAGAGGGGREGRREGARGCGDVVARSVRTALYSIRNNHGRRFPPRPAAPAPARPQTHT